MCVCGSGGKGGERKGAQRRRGEVNPILPNVELLLGFSQMLLIECSIISRKKECELIPFSQWEDVMGNNKELTLGSGYIHSCT